MMLQLKITKYFTELKMQANNKACFIIRKNKSGVYVNLKVAGFIGFMIVLVSLFKLIMPINYLMYFNSGCMFYNTLRNIIMCLQIRLICNFMFRYLLGL